MRSLRGLQWAVCMLCASHATAVTYNFEVWTPCPSPPVSLDRHLPSMLTPGTVWGADPRSQTTLYNEAYEWTKQVPLHHWNFDELPATRRLRRTLGTDPHENLECSHVSYSSVVKIPHTLDAYLDLGHFDAHVNKTVCASAHGVYSQITLSNILVVGSVDIKSEMRRHTGPVHVGRDKKLPAGDTVVTTCTATYDLPWYLHWIDANSMIYSSYHRDAQANTHQLCKSQEDVYGKLHTHTLKKLGIDFIVQS